MGRISSGSRRRSYPGASAAPSTDYQLLEEQTSGGLPRYVFLVSPEVGAIDERTLARVFLEEASAPAAAIP